MVASAAVVACGSAARATLIPILNGDFMLPDQSTNYGVYASADIASWLKAPMPDGYPGGTLVWETTAGTFYNVAGPTYITNLTSHQAAFLFAAPDVELYQDLTATYEAGQSYHLAFGLIPSDGSIYTSAIQVGTPIDVVLYYREGTARVPVASVAVANSPAMLANHTLMTNFTLDTAVVAAGDAWAGKAIGVQFLSQADLTNMGGVWDIGNVVLTAVPEPASMTLLAAGAMLLLVRRRR
jgi:hypothetical protein